MLKEFDNGFSNRFGTLADETETHEEAVKRSASQKRITAIYSIINSTDHKPTITEICDAINAGEIELKGKEK